MSPTWNASSVKAQLTSSRQNLRQLQDRKDSNGFILRKDIATLLRQQKIWLARAKAHNLLVESISADVLERLEMHVGALLEHFNELQLKTLKSLPALEAAVTIVYAAPYVDSKDLQLVCNLLVNHLGSEFALSASASKGNHVSPAVFRALNSPPPSALEINACLRRTAVSYGVHWEPEPSRHDIVNSLSELLAKPSQTLDLPTLRRLCQYGTPDKPSWLRPKIWKLYFYLIPTTKSTWPAELRKQRDNYYDLVQRLLEPFSSFDAPGRPLSPLDASLLDVSKQLVRIPSNLFVQLQEAPDISRPCPLDLDAPENIRISCASNLDSRLAILKNGQQAPESNSLPSIRSQVHDSAEGSQSTGVPRGAAFLSSGALNLPFVHPRHSSALLRILYMHTTLNPGALLPHVPSLLIPLYSVLVQETESEDAAHVEADTFWLFEVLLAEFNEFEDENIGSIWLEKFGQRVAWADGDFHRFLCARGLDPALPHYSYRWLATLLTHSLPLPSILLVWDVLFSCPERSRDVNHRMDHFLDVCTAMLLCAKSTLLQLERRNSLSHSLWTGQNITSELEQPPGFTDASAAAMSFLQNYSTENAGGIERILQTAIDLLHRRDHEESATRQNKLGLSNLIKGTMLRGFTNHTAWPGESDQPEDSSEDEGSQTETLSSIKSPTFTSRLASTVWKGITNQSAMEPPPSPPAPPTPTRVLPVPESIPDGSAVDGQWSSNAYNALWGYAERLKDSDTAATLSKVSSNWKAKTLVTAWRKGPELQDPNTGSPSPNVVEGHSQGSPNGSNGAYNDESSSSSRRSSMYLPPPRPPYFRSLRDSYIQSDTDKLRLSSANTSPINSTSDAGVISKTKASLVAITQSISPPLRSAPKPLILSSKSLVRPNKPPSRTPNSAPTLGSQDRGHANMRRGLHRDSLSSASLSDSMNRPLKGSASDRDSDLNSTSRRVPLNRKTVSPLAPGYRVQHSRYSPRTPSDVSQGSPIRMPRSSLDHNSDSQASPAMSDSPSFISPEVPHIPSKHNSGLSEGSEDHVLASLSQPRKPLHRKTPPTKELPEERTTIIKTPSRAMRVRTKRHQAEPTNIQSEDDDPAPEPTDKASSPDALKAEWPFEDQDSGVTPTAPCFDLDHSRYASPKPPKYVRKVSMEGKPPKDVREVRVRKVSSSQRTRKVSSDSREAVRNARDSAAEEGDDEGYDDLLSAYESEEGIRFFDT